MMTAASLDLAARCAVALYSGDRFLGSGFLVAPGQVLTCAHVAAGRRGRSPCAGQAGAHRVGTCALMPERPDRDADVRAA